jgi:hypothetical protein
VLVNDYSLDLVTNCAVIDDDPFNVSDHLPVMFGFNVAPLKFKDNMFCRGKDRGCLRYILPS